MDNKIINEDNVMLAFKGITKSVISSIPVVGSAAVEVWNEVESKQVERKMQRLYEFLIGLSHELGELKDEIKDECVKNDDIFDIFEQTSKQIISERNKDKRSMFKNIFEHTITDTEFDFDDTEQFLRILHDLSPFQLKILAVLYNPSRYNKQNGNIIPDPINNQYQSSWGQYSITEIMSRLFSNDKDEIRPAIAYLYYNGLVVEKLMDRTLQTNDNPIHILDNSLTSFGKRFVRYILDPRN
ncbi:MAG: hypothetical protein VZR53_07635 [Prevotella sp.]|nr:hypothetical protein [Prevotella sp.]